MTAHERQQRASLTEGQPFLNLAYRPAGVPVTPDDAVATMAPSFFSATRAPMPQKKVAAKTKARTAWARTAAMINAALAMRGGVSYTKRGGVSYDKGATRQATEDVHFGYECVRITRERNAKLKGENIMGAFVLNVAPVEAFLDASMLLQLLNLTFQVQLAVKSGDLIFTRCASTLVHREHLSA
jgi:hypothetical protein